MKKESTGIIFLELFIISLMAFMIYLLFYEGVSIERLQFVVFLLCLSIFPPLILEKIERKISFVNAKSMVLMGIFYWILVDALVRRPGLEEFMAEKILQVVLMITSFSIMVYVGYIIKWPDFFIHIFRKLDYGYSFNEKKLKKFILISFFLGLSPVLIWGGGLDRVIWVLTHAGRWNAGWERSRWGDWKDYIKSVLAVFKIMSVQLSVFYLIFVKRNLIFIILIFLVLWTIFVTGARGMMGAVALPFFLLYFFRFSGKKKRWLVIVGLFLFYTVLELQLITRTAVVGTPIVDVFNEEISGIVKKGPLEYNRDDQFFQMLKYVTIVPEKILHSGEWLILRPFYHFIPRAIWKDKPQGITRFFEERVDEQNYGLTTFAGSIIGDFYLANGWLGILISGLLMGFLAKQFDSLVEMANRSPAVLLIYVYGLIFLFSAIRSYQVIYDGWYIFIFLYWIMKTIKKKEPLKI